jgi:hypothetical protein
LLATPYTAKLALEVFPWIGAVLFAVVLGLFFKPLRDDVAHARVEIYVDDLKSVSHGYAGESKETTFRVRRSFAPRPKAEDCKDEQYEEANGPQDACRQMQVHDTSLLRPGRPRPYIPEGATSMRFEE